MSSNMLKKRLQAGKACVNGWLAIPSGFSAEVMAQCGWDSVTVDMQHGVQDYQSMVACFQAMDRHPMTPLVRVPWNEPGIVGKVLDGGAWGVICPMVNNAAEAKALVVLCALSAEGQAQQRPDPRRRLRRGRRLPEDRQRRGADHPDDRDPGGDRQYRRDPRCAGHQRHLCRPVRSRPVARPGAEARPRGAAGLRIYEKLTAACKKRGSSPASTTARRPTPPGRPAWASSSARSPTTPA